MELKKFDPFRNRLARDIRNELSKSFIESLRERNASFFKRRAAVYLEQHLEQVHKMYLETRLEKYAAVFAAIEQGHVDNELQQAEILWEHELYFEMHELLENVWIDAEGEERRALQGLIRAAGMKIHAENGNKKAAIKMGMKAQSDLQLYGSALSRPNKIESILAEIKETLTNMDTTSGG